MTSGGARRWVLAIIVGSAAVRFWLAGVTGLGVDESYMVGNARELSLAYFDHPPLHVWMVWLAETVFTGEAPLAVRTPFILLFAGSTWLMYRLGERLFGAAAGLWAAIAFNLAPVFSLADASWVLPDGPLIFFLLAAANVLARILFDDRPASAPAIDWILAGAFGGLALLSKYSAVLLFAAVFIYLLVTPWQRLLATPRPWLGVLAALIVFSPAIVWNIANGFAGFAFQGGRFGNLAPDFGGLLASLGGQLAYLTPWLGIPFALSLVAALRAGRGDPKALFLAILAVVPIAFFTVGALFVASLPHWAMPGWLFAIPLFGRDAAALAVRRPRFARGYMAASAVVFVALVGGFALQATRGSLVSAAALAGNPALDPTVDLVNWTDLPAELEARGLAGPDLVVAATRWFDAGKASYALGPDVPVLCLCADPRHFAFRADPARFAGRDVVVIVPAHAGSIDAAGGYFAEIEPIGQIGITRAGETILSLQVAIGRNLQIP